MRKYPLFIPTVCVAWGIVKKVSVKRVFSIVKVRGTIDHTYPLRTYLEGCGTGG